MKYKLKRDKSEQLGQWQIVPDNPNAYTTIYHNFWDAIKHLIRLKYAKSSRN